MPNPATGNHTETYAADTLYGYDDQSRLTTVAVKELNGQQLSTPPVTTYTYDAAGNKLSETLPDGEVTTYTYDSLNRLVTQSLYVKFSCRFQPSQHEADHCDVDHAFSAVGQLLIVLAVPPTPADPCERALDDPPLGQHRKPMRLIGPLDDPHSPPAPTQGEVDQRAGVPAVGEDRGQAGELADQVPQHEPGRHAILQARRMHQDDQQQAELVDDDVPLAAVDLLARVIPADPPFSVVFTDWESMIATDGAGSAPAPVRTRATNAWLIAGHTPSRRNRR
jgi:YD repeat-containing protein